MMRIRTTALMMACSVMIATIATAQNAATSTQTPTPAAKSASVAKADNPAAKLPKAVLDAFTKAYPKAVIKGASEEKENGKTTWEVESTDNGLARDLVYTPNGSVVEIEEEVPAPTLPAAVTAALTTTHAKASITKAEKMTKGKVVTYELAIAGAGAAKSIEISPEGKIIPKAKKDSAKEEKEDDAKKDVKKK
ncbi:MAG: PepSY-like domain-containing protein [Acidobacteriota bacterium]